MFFVAIRRTVEMSLATPTDRCCNCGARNGIESVETPMRLSSFYFIAGTELTVLDSFPYCQSCASSARRVKPSVLGQLLSGCLATAVLFFLFTLLLGILPMPEMLVDNLFKLSLMSGLILTYGYFYMRSRGAGGRSYYQPIRLERLSGGGEAMTLRFFNPEFARLVREYNADLIRTGQLTVLPASHATAAAAPR